MFPPFDPTLEETQVAVQAIKLANFQKYSYIFFERDSKRIIYTLQNINLSPPLFLASYLLNVKVVLSSLIC